MKVAAYQTRLPLCGTVETIELIRDGVDRCESEGVEILCCPEAVLGGLADDATNVADIAINVECGQLAAVLAPLASDTVATIVGFTEITAKGHLYNSAVVFYRGIVTGLYRKLHPAINRSIYRAGDRIPVFKVGELTFGILICNDTNYVEPARAIAAQGATAIFVPTNNSLPRAKTDVIADARAVDIARAKENRVTVIRADVAGFSADRISYGSSCIAAPDGTVLQTARPLVEDMLTAKIEITSRSTARCARTG